MEVVWGREAGGGGEGAVQVEQEAIVTRMEEQLAVLHHVIQQHIRAEPDFKVGSPSLPGDLEHAHRLSLSAGRRCLSRPILCPPFPSTRITDHWGSCSMTYHQLHPGFHRELSAAASGFQPELSSAAPWLPGRADQGHPSVAAGGGDRSRGSFGNGQGRGLEVLGLKVGFRVGFNV